jgi:plastocyanin
MNHTIAAIASGVGSLLLFSACGGASESSTPTVVDDAAVTVRALEGIQWDSRSYTATAGTVRIVLENESSLPHNLVVVDEQNTQLPPTLDAPSRNDTDEGSFSLQAGTYTVLCRIPGHANMNAQLDVD